MGCKETIGGVAPMPTRQSLQQTLAAFKGIRGGTPKSRIRVSRRWQNISATKKLVEQTDAKSQDFAFRNEASTSIRLLSR